MEAGHLNEPGFNLNLGAFDVFLVEVILHPPYENHFFAFAEKSLGSFSYAIPALDIEIGRFFRFIVVLDCNREGNTGLFVFKGLNFEVVSEAADESDGIVHK